VLQRVVSVAVLCLSHYSQHHSKKHFTTILTRSTKSRVVVLLGVEALLSQGPAELDCGSCHAWTLRMDVDFRTDPAPDIRGIRGQFLRAFSQFQGSRPPSFGPVLLCAGAVTFRKTPKLVFDLLTKPKQATTILSFPPCAVPEAESFSVGINSFGVKGLGSGWEETRTHSHSHGSV
jgi:hypothetical protein